MDNARKKKERKRERERVDKKKCWREERLNHREAMPDNRQVQAYMTNLLGSSILARTFPLKVLILTKWGFLKKAFFSS